MEAEAGNNDVPNPMVEDPKFGTKSKPTTARNKENVIAVKAKKRLLLDSKKSLDASKSEVEKKLRCLRYEANIKRQRIEVSQLTTGKVRKPPVVSSKPHARLGDYCNINPDLTPGNKSFGGKAWIMAIHRQGRQLEYTVKYGPCESGTVK